MATRFRASLLGILLLIGIGLQGWVRPQTPNAPTVLNENFDSFSDALNDGWVFVNGSEPRNDDNSEHNHWKQGRSNNQTYFNAHTGSANSFAGSSWLASTFDTDSIVSDWLLTPPLLLENGKTVSFWTRSANCAVPDRLDIRYSTAGTSTNVASGNNTGDFSTLIAQINPDQETGHDPDGSDGYPCNSWAQFTYTLSGINQPTVGRIGFRHYNVNTVINSQYLGIDDFSYSGNLAGGTQTPNTSTPTPTSTSTATATTTPTSTMTASPTNTGTRTPTLSPTSTATNTVTASPTNTPTNTATGTPPTATFTHTPTRTPTITPTNTPTRTPTITPTRTPTATSVPQIQEYRVYMCLIQNDA